MQPYLLLVELEYRALLLVSYAYVFIEIIAGPIWLTHFNLRSNWLPFPSRSISNVYTHYHSITVGNPVRVCLQLLNR